MPVLDTQIVSDELTEDETPHFVHIINPPNNLHIWTPGMEMVELVNIAKTNGIPIKALCGLVFTPKNSVDKFPACEPCIKVAGDLMRAAGE